MESKKIAVLKALDVCSDFVAGKNEIREVMQKIKVTNTLCEATNGHVMIRLEIAGTMLPKDKTVLVDAGKAEIMAALGVDDAAHVAKLFNKEDSAKSFPNTVGALETIEKNPVVARIGIAPAYLEIIGKAFKELGADYVELVIRGKEVGLVCTGIDGQNVKRVGTAVVMPIRMNHPE